MAPVLPVWYRRSLHAVGYPIWRDQVSRVFDVPPRCWSSTSKARGRWRDESCQDVDDTACAGEVNMLAIADPLAQAEAAVDDVLLARVRAEFREMPGLRLTAVQAGRLWGLEGAVCNTVLRALIEDGFLRRTRDGSFMRADMI